MFHIVNPSTSSPEVSHHGVLNKNRFCGTFLTSTFVKDDVPNEFQRNVLFKTDMISDFFKRGGERE